MKLNIFRNPFVDTQVAMLMDNFDAALRKQTESHWRNTIADEILEAFPHLANIRIVAERIRNG